MQKTTWKEKSKVLREAVKKQMEEIAKEKAMKSPWKRKSKGFRKFVKRQQAIVEAHSPNWKKKSFDFRKKVE